MCDTVIPQQTNTVLRLKLTVTEQLIMREITIQIITAFYMYPCK